MNVQDRPWMQALEMQFAAIKVLDAQGEQYGTIAQGITFQGFLRRAETYSWSRDTSYAVALASKTIPGASRLERSVLLGSGFGWWWFDPPAPIQGGAIDALLFGLVNGQVWFQAFIATDRLVKLSKDQAGDDLAALDRVKHNQQILESRGLQLSPFVGFSFDIDRSTVAEFAANVEMADDPNKKALGQHMIAALRFFIAGCVWCQQRVLTFSSGHIERHRRKQLARENDAPLPGDVKVIQLRRTESQSKPSNAAPSDDPVEWSCRWVVNGHWRNQPYPSKDERKLIYIMPYVKGPEDRPLRIPTHTVYQVSR